MQIDSAVQYETNRAASCRPFFSICIPQHNRTDFLVKACETFALQSFNDFELCISDDCSTDKKEGELLESLRDLGLTFVYARQTKNLQYDENLRSAIALSSGQYALLMGNDDGLTNSDVLWRIRDEIDRFESITVAITNYRELPSGKIFRRVTKTGLIGCGPAVAAATFRDYSFLSGIVLDGDRARKEATNACDGSEMYQMYLGTRLIAAGGKLLGIDEICVDKDIQVPGQSVDSYRLKAKSNSYYPVEHILPMGRLLEVVAAGLKPYDTGAQFERHLVRIASQLYRFTYPFWIVEYRRVQSWTYALGVFFGLRPGVVARGLFLSNFAMLRLWLIYVIMGTVALATPIRLFDALRSRMYALAKRRKLL